MSKLIPTYIEQALRIEHLERELAAIKSQPVPVEPEYPSPQYAQIIQFEGCPSVVISPETYEEITAYIDTLKQQLQVAQQERDGYLDLNRDCAELALNHLERELAEAKEQLRLCNVDQFTTAAELAELKEELNDRRKFAYAVEQALDGLKGDYVEIIKELRKDAENYRYCFNAAIDAAMKECGK